MRGLPVLQHVGWMLHESGRGTYMAECTGTGGVFVVRGGEGMMQVFAVLNGKSVAKMTKHWIMVQILAV